MLPEWVDIPGLGARLNGIFHQSWRLINEIVDEDDPEELADMFDELVSLEKRIANQRMIDLHAHK